MIGHRLTKRLALLIIAVIALLSGGFAVALGAGFSGGEQAFSVVTDNGPPPIAQPGQGAPAFTADQQAAFRALRRSPIAADSAALQDPAVLRALGPIQASEGANPSQAREAGQSANVSVFLVPGNGVLCLVTATHGTAGAGCTPSKVAETLGLLQFGFTPGKGYDVEGVFPDGTHDVRVTHGDGRTEPVSLEAGSWFSLSSVTRLTAITFIGGDGTQHRLPLAS